ncbi:MAG: hypothetical protein ABSF23_15540 [Terracidiphilus sp.]
MPYRVAWPLIKSGVYPRHTGSIADFSGSLEKKGTPRLMIAQIKKITEDAWAGKRWDLSPNVDRRGHSVLAHLPAMLLRTPKAPIRPVIGTA